MLPACPIPIPAPADTDNAPLDPFRSDTLLRALDEALMVSVNDPAPDALAREMLFPPTMASETAVPVTDVPPPLRDWVPYAGAGTDTVTLPFPAPILAIPAPLKLRFCPKGPDEELVVFPMAKMLSVCWVDTGDGTEIVTLPAPTPTEAMPAPEIFNKFENVPEEETVVFPSAVRETDDVCTDADKVMVLLACPMPMPAPAESDNCPLEPFRLCT